MNTAELFYQRSPAELVGLRYLPRVPGSDYTAHLTMIQADDRPFSGAVTTFRKYIVAGLVQRQEYGPLASLGLPDVGAAADWWLTPAGGHWEGWYWEEEIAVARGLGWDCLGLEGVAFHSWEPPGDFLLAESIDPGHAQAVLSYYRAQLRLRLWEEYKSA